MYISCTCGFNVMSLDNLRTGISLISTFHLVVSPGTSLTLYLSRKLFDLGCKKSSLNDTRCLPLFASCKKNRKYYLIKQKCSKLYKFYLIPVCQSFYECKHMVLDHSCIYSGLIYPVKHVPYHGQKSQLQFYCDFQQYIKEAKFPSLLCVE